MLEKRLAEAERNLIESNYDSGTVGDYLKQIERVGAEIDSKVMEKILSSLGVTPYLISYPSRSIFSEGFVDKESQTPTYDLFHFEIPRDMRPAIFSQKNIRVRSSKKGLQEISEDGLEKEIKGLNFHSMGELPDLSKYVALRYLNVSFNDLYELFLPETLVELRELYCHNNNLTGLGIPESYENLRRLNCSYNKLTRLEIPKTLKKLRDIDKSGNPNLI